MARPPTTYWDYIRVEELLSLQHGLSSEPELVNDEVLFITVHQIDELWFKLILRELVTVRDLFARGIVPEPALSAAVRGIRRMEILLHHVASHFEVMETMTTRDYLGFRDKLSPASGFQSAQLREIELLLGLRDEDRIPLGPDQSYRQALRSAEGAESPASRRVEARANDLPTLAHALGDWLYRTPIQSSLPSYMNDDLRVREFIDAYTAVHAGTIDRTTALALAHAKTDVDRERIRARAVREKASARAFLSAEDEPEATRARTARIRAALIFIESYREVPLLAWPREVIESIVSFEQAFLIFRQRHARMVERVIGRRPGTGGSSGVDYLDQTALRYRIFGDVWAVRTLLVQESDLPPLTDPDFYEFAEPRGGRSTRF